MSNKSKKLAFASRELIVVTPEIIGRQVSKFSGKPFKSRLKFNTIKGVTCNPHTGKTAFTFVEDDSIVDADMCQLRRKLAMMHESQEAFFKYVLEHKEDFGEEVIEEATNHLRSVAPAVCKCVCHQHDVVTLHCLPCCHLTYKKYLDANFNVNQAEYDKWDKLLQANRTFETKGSNPLTENFTPLPSAEQEKTNV